MSAPSYVFKMVTNRKGRPITVYLNRPEKPNPKEFEATYVDPVDGKTVDIELTGTWIDGNGPAPKEAYELKLKKI